MVHLLALVAAFIPAILWLWFFYSRDRYEREPKALIGKLFLWGLLAGPSACSSPPSCTRPTTFPCSCSSG